MPLAILILVAAYLLGSIPFGYLLVRYLKKQDIRSVGSGNIGATNVAREGGKGLGIATLALDALKAIAAVLLARHFFPSATPIPSTLAVAAGVTAVLGHMFPLWLRFHGGKGVASALGVFIALAPWVALSSFLVFAVIVALTRLVSLGSTISACTVPLFSLILPPGRSAILAGGFSLIALLVILKHHANISRLLKGTEPRFSKSKSTPAKAHS